MVVFWAVGPRGVVEVYWRCAASMIRAMTRHHGAASQKTEVCANYREAVCCLIELYN